MLWPGPAALVLAVLGACYGGDPDFVSDEEDALVELSESATPETEPDAETALAHEAEAERVDNVVRELDTLYADPEQARTREQQARSELEQGAEVDRVAVELARLLAEQLQAADPERADAVRESGSKAPAGDAGLLE